MSFCRPTSTKVWRNCKRTKNPKQTKHPKKWTRVISNDLFLILTLTLTKHAEEEDEEEDEEEEDNNSALYSYRFVVFLNRSSSLGSRVLRLRERVCLFFFRCTKGHVQLCAFFVNSTQFNNTPRTTTITTNGDEEDEEESEA